MDNGSGLVCAVVESLARVCWWVEVIAFEVARTQNFPSHVLHFILYLLHSLLLTLLYNDGNRDGVIHIEDVMLHHDALRRAGRRVTLKARS